MSSLSLFGLGGLAALGVGFGALVTSLQEHPAPSVQTYGAAALAPATAPSAPVSPTPPPSIVTFQPQPILATTKPATKPPAKTHTVRAAKAPHAQPAVELSPQQAWEQKRLAYERALAAYDANESAEGYRWAQLNHVRLERYCRVAERRTPAFVQGCLGYTRGELPPSSAKG
jgi:hypothetical protein